MRERRKSGQGAAPFVREMLQARRLSHEEQHALIDRHQAGDEEATRLLVVHNAALIAKVAAKHGRSADPCVSFEDSFQVGVIGFLTALRKFDTSKGYRLSTYALHWIRQSVTRQVDETAGRIRVPVHARHAFNRVASRVPRGDFRALREEAERSGENVGQVEAAALITWGAYLETQHHETGSEDWAPFELVDDGSLPDESRELAATSVESLFDRAGLDERTRAVLRDHVGDDETLEDVGAALGVSRQRVGQIKGESLRRLRAVANA